MENNFILYVFLIVLALATPTPPPPQSDFVPVATFDDYNNQQPQSNFPSIFSSFSNILSLKSNPSEQYQNVPPPPLIGVEDNFAEQTSNPAPVPFFNPVLQQQQQPPQQQQQHQPPPQSSQGSKRRFLYFISVLISCCCFLGHLNTYRRIGNKRPQYVQPPGLGGGSQPPKPQPSPEIPTFHQQTPVESQSSVFLNPVSTIPQFASWTNTNTISNTMATVSPAEVPVVSNGQLPLNPQNANGGTERSGLQAPVVDVSLLMKKKFFFKTNSCFRTLPWKFIDQFTITGFTSASLKVKFSGNRSQWWIL